MVRPSSQPREQFCMHLCIQCRDTGSLTTQVTTAVGAHPKPVRVNTDVYSVIKALLLRPRSYFINHSMNYNDSLKGFTGPMNCASYPLTFSTYVWCVWYLAHHNHMRMCFSL